jgi:hypothetical protein
MLDVGVRTLLARRGWLLGMFRCVLELLIRHLRACNNIHPLHTSAPSAFPEYTPALHVHIPKWKELCQEAVGAIVS